MLWINSLSLSSSSCEKKIPIFITFFWTSLAKKQTVLARSPLPLLAFSPSKLHIPDRDKYSTLHTCRPKILPGEKDGVVVVLGMLRVGALLRVRPAAHLLQAPGWIPPLDQAD